MIRGKIYSATKEFTLLGQILKCSTTHEVKEHDVILLTEQGHCAYVRELMFGIGEDFKMETMLIDMGPKFVDTHIAAGEMVFTGYGWWDPAEQDIHVVEMARECHV